MKTLKRRRAALGDSEGIISFPNFYAFNHPIAIRRRSAVYDKSTDREMRIGT